MIIKHILFVENTLDYQIISGDFGQNYLLTIGHRNLLKEMVEMHIQITLMTTIRSLSKICFGQIIICFQTILNLG